MQKTFKIGEYCLHGIIKVELKNVHLTVKVIDYFTKEVKEKETFHFVDKHKINTYLQMFTTDYYVDKIINHFYA